MGANTVIRDDPSLTIRLVESERQPLRIVIDPNSRIPSDSKVLSDGNATRHLTSDFRGLGAMLDMLGDLEIQRLLVEGGPDTINHFLNQSLVDEFILVRSNVSHNEPVLTEFDLSEFGSITESNWGDESVKIHLEIEEAGNAGFEPTYSAPKAERISRLPQLPKPAETPPS